MSLHSEAASDIAVVTLESLNPLDLTLEELRSAKALIEEALSAEQVGGGIEIAVAGEVPVGSGTPFTDTVLILLPSLLFIQEKAYDIIIDKVVDLMRARFKRPHGRSRRREIKVYGPDGKLLNTITVEEWEATKD